MWLLIVVILTCLELYPVHAYRDGARNVSCFNHSVDHKAQVSNNLTYDCDVNPPACPYFLRIRKVLDTANLTVNANETANNITCNHLYAST